MKAALNRLKEKSTYAGLIAVLSAAGVLGLDEAMWQQVFGVVAGIAGLAAMVMAEKTPGE